jgi:hypothetical protein
MLLSAPACVQLCTQQGLVVTNQARMRTITPATEPITRGYASMGGDNGHSSSLSGPQAVSRARSGGFDFADANLRTPDGLSSC